MRDCNRPLSQRHRVLLTSTAALVLSACGLLPDDILGDYDHAPSEEHEGPNPSALQAFGSCDDLLTSIQERTLDSLLVRAEQLREAPTNYYGEPGILIDGGGILIDDQAQAPISADGNVAVGSPVSGGGFSGTTVQDFSVDEADIVKADGDSILLLEDDVLFRAQAWPAEELEITGAIIIEGYPYEMHVNDGVALVYSEVYQNLRFEADPGAVADPNNYDYYYEGYSEYTKLTLLDVSGNEPVVVRETYLEGYYQSSRRHGDVVRTVVNDVYGVPRFDDFYLEYFTPFGDPYRQQDIDAQVDAWLERSSWAITESELSDWLPQHYDRVNGELSEVPVDCSQYFEPNESAARVDRGSNGIASIAALSLQGGAFAPMDTISLLGRPSQMYSNEDVLVLASTDYEYSEQGYSQSTTLHRFDIDGMDTPYVASGTVPGGLNDQFSLDEHEGVIRVSTTDNSRSLDGLNSEGPENRVFTLATNGDWLDIWGQTEIFGLNEQIYATRFMGDRAYVVTFRQTDPLFVLDLEDPGNPQVLGELEIPGFSNFLFPLANDHLFAIGRDATEDGRTQEVALQIFDVRDATAPSLRHRYVYDDADGSTSIQVDHRALTFDPNSDRVAFPLRRYSNTGRSSGLEIFSVDPSTGIDRLGEVSAATDALSFEDCLREMGWSLGEFEEAFGADPGLLAEMTEIYRQECTFYVPQETMRRGMFREDVVFGISTGRILAQSLDALGSEPLASVQLPNRYGFGGGAMVGAAGGSFGGSGGSSMTPNEGGGMAGSGMAGSGASAGGASSTADPEAQ